MVTTKTDIDKEIKRKNSRIRILESKRILLI